MDNSTEKTRNPPAKGKIKTFLIGKELKTKDLRQTAERRASGSAPTPKPESKPPDSLRREASQAATRLLRCATALRLTAPLGCGSRRLVWPKAGFRLRPKNE